MSKKSKKKLSKNYIPYDRTQVVICKCDQQVRYCYSIGKKVKWKVFNIDGSEHTCGHL